MYLRNALKYGNASNPFPQNRGDAYDMTEHLKGRRELWLVMMGDSSREEEEKAPETRKGLRMLKNQCQVSCQHEVRVEPPKV